MKIGLVEVVMSSKEDNRGDTNLIQKFLARMVNKKGLMQAAKPVLN